MKVLLRILALALLCSSLLGMAAASEDEIDFLHRLQISSPQLATDIGLQKLSDAERKNLNALLNTVYRAGKLEPQPERPPTPAKPTGGKAYTTKVESGEGSILKLANGAVVEVTSGYLGYVGYRKDAVFFDVGSGCRVWIEGKKVFTCDVLKAPSDSKPGQPAKLVTISQVKAHGEILVMSDGSIYKVGSMDTINTSLWLGLSEALILDDGKLINLAEGSSMVSISKVR